MIRSFRDRGTRDVFNVLDTPAARRTRPDVLWDVARRRMSQLVFRWEEEPVNVGIEDYH